MVENNSVLLGKFEECLNSSIENHNEAFQFLFKKGFLSSEDCVQIWKDNTPIEKQREYFNA